MPIAALQPGPDRREVTRSRTDPAIDISTPSEDLLPSGGGPVPWSAPAPGGALALASHRLLRMLRDHPRGAGLWGEPAFALEVEAVRGQLAPVSTRHSLASSYGREARRALTDKRLATWEPARIHPVDVAYAIRWLELGDGAPRPPWSAFCAAPG
jgi:hypothetical protein